MNAKLGHLVACVLVALISSAVTYSLDAAVQNSARGIRKGSHVNLSPEDYFEITQLMSEYPRDVDAGAVRDASWMFTPDARSVIGGPPMTKPVDFKNFYGALASPQGQARRGGNRHFNASYVIVGLPDGTARGSTYMLGISIKAPGAKPTLDQITKYEDIYVKTPNGWKMKDRIARIDQYVGSYEKVAPSPVLADPATWKTETDEVIQQMWAEGKTRDADGEPLGSGGGPSLKTPFVGRR